MAPTQNTAKPSYTLIRNIKKYIILIFADTSDLQLCQESRVTTASVAAAARAAGAADSAADDDDDDAAAEDPNSEKDKSMFIFITQKSLH